MQNAIRRGEISAGHGRAIISLDNEEDRTQLYLKIIKEKLNVRQAEQWANSLKNPKKVVEKTAKSLPNHLKKAQKSLSDILDTDVEIKSTARGNKGKIVLSFKNDDELQNILTHFRL